MAALERALGVRPSRAYNSKVTRIANRSAILRMLVRRGAVSRTEIVAVTGLSSGAVSRITNGLIAEGLIREVGSSREAVRTRVGRTPALLSLDEKLAAIGVHIQPDVISAVLVTPNGRIVRRTDAEVSTRLLPHVAVEHAAALVEALVSDAERAQVPRPVAVGVGVPGMVDAASGQVRYSAILGWYDVSVQHLLQRRLPRMPVVVTHNVAAMALAAHWFGPAGVTAAEDLLLVYAGRGIGVGLVIRGEIYSGHRGHAGELGHVGNWSPRTCWCGRTGCLETVTGGAAILHQAADVLGMEPQRLTLHQLAQSLAGDPRVRLIVEAAGEALAAAVLDLARVLDPAVVAVAGPVFSLGPFREAFDRRFEAGYTRSDEALPVIWVDLPDLPPLGAASVAIQKVLFTGAYRDPTSHGLVAGYADEEE